MCIWLCRKYLSEDMPDGANSELQDERTSQQAEAQRPQPPALSNTAPGFVLPGDVLPLPRASQATTSPFEASRPMTSVLSPHPVIAAAAAGTPSTAAGPGFPTDELCSRPLINMLMADYLDLVYPLVPVVHRPSFRHDLASNRDVADRKHHSCALRAPPVVTFWNVRECITSGYVSG